MTENAAAFPHRTLTDVWKYHLKDARFYHGTSETFLPAIQSNGLSPTETFFPQEDVAVLVEIGNKLEMSAVFDYLRKKPPAFYCTTDEARACEYAYEGPEFLYESVLRTSQLLLDPEYIHEQFRKRPITLKERTKLTEIKRRTIEFLWNHRPIMVIIDRNSPTFRQYLEGQAPDARMLYDYDFFADRASAVAKQDGIDSSQAGEGLADNLHSTLYDFPVDITIPPEDLSFISGSDFYQLGCSDLPERFWAIATFLKGIKQ